MTLKQKLFAHVETMRPYTLLWCGLVSLTGACLINQDIPSFQNAALIFFIPILGWIAGLYLADYCDRDLDAIQKPYRPIPSGRITPKEALLVGAIFAVAGLILTIFLNITNLLFVFIASALVFCYAKITKARDLLGNLNRGALTVTTYLFGVFALGTPLSSIPVYVWILSFVFFFHDTNSNIIGAIRDVQGDTTGGYKTTPVKYGIKKALYLSVILSIVYLLITIAVTRFSDVFPHPFFFYSLFAFGVVVLSFMYITLFDAKEQITRKNALLAHELFVAERIIFASAFIVGIVQSHALSLSLFMISLLLTLFFQHLLRERYELT